MTPSRSTPPPVTTVLLDYGEVVSVPQPARVRARLEELGAAPPEDFWAAYWAERAAYDSGMSALEYWTRIGDRIGADWTPAVRQELWATDVGGWLLPDPDTVTLVDLVSRGPARLALLSNAPFDIAAALRRSPVLSGFDALFFSCDIGMCKPDPAVYTHVLEALDSAPEQTLFVDDREENVRAAQKLGITARLYTGAAGLAELLDRTPGIR
ncbi:HAD family hydrolase [Actinorugispora endophytica]|uniref:Putative hydrolase of the HAD superfamily n=1 Tax=Actinorugispora endophytica TaxID=1605990 RepID=A0A4R6UN90_9ACTN|nr:HAD family phosphatase [Actinorugispora endophytica]TDQ48262.1 putative hydrolase of the HAD superfamily [Actinorugispora endophytica]